MSLVGFSRVTCLWPRASRLFKLMNRQKKIREKIQCKKKIIKQKKERSPEQTESTGLLLCVI
jgi:hypothetical protein